MPRLNDSVNTPVNKSWKRQLIATAGRCPGTPSHTRVMRYLAQWALPQLIERLDAGQDTSDILSEQEVATTGK